jgi:type I restriction enzyme S subunit
MTTVPDKVQQAYGQLPHGWRLERLKFYASVRNSNVDKTISDDETPVRLCNYTDVYYNDRITPDLEFMQGSATDAEIEKFQLKKGQVIITKDSEGWDDIGIPALVTEDMPEVLCGYHLSVLEPGKELDGGFLAWLCRSEPLNDQFKLGANGVTRYGLGQYPMKNAFVALPPLETQRRVARFLDEKTARIDGLIEKKRALLDQLAEKRQALITRAVTQGLNPDAPMKDSGIDWLGEIPAHWEVLPLRRLSKEVSTGRTPPSAGPDYFLDGEINWFTPGDFDGGIELQQSNRRVSQEAIEDGAVTLFPAGSVFLVGIGATLGKVAVGIEAGSANQQINIIVLEDGNDPHFIAYFLHCFREEVRVASNGNTLGILNQNGTKSLPVVRPPATEQRKVADVLRLHDENFEATSRKIVESIELLFQYRAAFITMAVTGNLEGLR